MSSNLHNGNSVITFIREGTLLRSTLKNDAQLLADLDAYAEKSEVSHAQVAIWVCCVEFTGKTEKGYAKRIRTEVLGG